MNTNSVNHINRVNWKIRVGNFLFKYRSFTPIPLILTVFLIFTPMKSENDSIINLLGLLVSLCGEMIRVFAVGFSFHGTSGRESYLRAENLNLTGIYSVVRNPLYIGNFLIFIGLVAVFSNPFALLVFGFFLVLQYYFIILAEEHFLLEQYGETYQMYCSEVKRILPTFKVYKKNSNPFNLRKVIFKENDSVFNLLFMYLMVLIYKAYLIEGKIDSLWEYVVPGSLLLLVYAGIKITKKKSAMFDK